PKKEAPKAAPAEEKPEPKKEAPKAAKPAAPKAAPAADAAKQAADKATEERHRRFLLGKKAARTIKMDNGIVIVEAGADITEEVLQKAKLANKFIELSMNVQ
ncbi:MAG: photosystem reaction center subunit H, partial [Selenomonadaceae bacterium]|nr:photosystem reaction center subunit H [Selenomonadaceae bacterium]